MGARGIGVEDEAAASAASASAGGGSGATLDDGILSTEGLKSSQVKSSRHGVFLSTNEFANYEFESR
jgi:hypothetical protein